MHVLHHGTPPAKQCNIYSSDFNLCNRLKLKSCPSAARPDPANSAAVAWRVRVMSVDTHALSPAHPRRPESLCRRWRGRRGVDGSRTPPTVQLISSDFVGGPLNGVGCCRNCECRGTPSRPAGASSTCHSDTYRCHIPPPIESLYPSRNTSNFAMAVWRSSTYKYGYGYTHFTEIDSID